MFLIIIIRIGGSFTTAAYWQKTFLKLALKVLLSICYVLNVIKIIPHENFGFHQMEPF